MLKALCGLDLLKLLPCLQHCEFQRRVPIRTHRIRTMWMAASNPAVLAAAPNRVSSPMTV